LRLPWRLAAFAAALKICLPSLAALLSAFAAALKICLPSLAALLSAFAAALKTCLQFLAVALDHQLFSGVAVLYHKMGGCS